jgi:hypothetical protein
MCRFSLLLLSYSRWWLGPFEERLERLGSHISLLVRFAFAGSFCFDWSLLVRGHLGLCFGAILGCIASLY